MRTQPGIVIRDGSCCAALRHHIHEQSFTHAHKMEVRKPIADSRQPLGHNSVGCLLSACCTHSVYLSTPFAVMQWADQQPKFCGGSQKKHRILPNAAYLEVGNNYATIETNEACQCMSILTIKCDAASILLMCAEHCAAVLASSMWRV